MHILQSDLNKTTYFGPPHLTTFYDLGRKRNIVLHLFRNELKKAATHLMYSAKQVFRITSLCRIIQYLTIILHGHYLQESHHTTCRRALLTAFSFLLC